MQTQSYTTGAEIIGLEVQAVNIRGNGKVSLSGKIIDETKNTILVETKKGIKKLLKKDWQLTITIDNQKVKIKGEKMQKRPEERIKIIR